MSSQPDPESLILIAKNYVVLYILLDRVQDIMLCVDFGATRANMFLDLNSKVTGQPAFVAGSKITKLLLIVHVSCPLTF